jgi:hypothetical protein
MNDSTHVEHQLDTIHRQAKRFAVRLKLPTTAAKTILARAFYRCAEWRDLEARLKSQDLDRHIQMLTALPRSDQARLYFAGIRCDLAKSLSQHMLTNSNLAGLIDLVQEVFVVDSVPTTLDDLVPTLKAAAWRATNIGPDPWAVVESNIVVNGVCIRLVGTRTYLPRYYDFGPKHEFGEYAEPAGGRLQIVWAEPMAWYQAALDYLDDLDAEDIKFPDVELTKEMSQHQAWFEAALVAVDNIVEYRAGDNDLLPVVLEDGNCYVVFGYPVRTPETNPTSFTTVELASTSDNFSQVVMLHENPVCLEWIAYDQKCGKHSGEFDDYFLTLKEAIFRDECLPITPRTDGQSGLLFVRPATEFDIRQELKVDFTYLANEVAFVVKTSNLTLSRKLLEKVANRDLMVYAPEGHPRYFAQFLVPQTEGPPRLSLSFDSESPNWSTMSALVQSSYWEAKEEQWELLVEVAPKLMNLIDRIGKKVLDRAMCHGLIQRFATTVLDEFEQPPTRCKQIPPVSKEIASALNKPLDGEGHLTMRYIRNIRDNF